MKFGHIEIFVSDPMKSTDFYVAVLGFTLEETQKDRFVWLSLDKISVLLRPLRQSASAPTYQEAASAFSLYTDDLKGTVENLKKQGLKFKGTDGSDNCLTFTDLDGNWFQLVNPKEH